MSCVLTELFLYYGYNMLQHSNGTVHDLILCAFQPQWALYCSFGVIYMSYYFVLLVHYTGVRQHALLDELCSLTAMLQPTKKSKAPQPTTNVDEQIWRRFVDLNQRILAFFDELHAYNRYWSPFVSIYFVNYSGMISYLAYGFLFDQAEFELGKSSFFVFFTVELLAMLLFITYECSRIVRQNVRMFKTNRKFCYDFTRYRSPRLLYILNVCLRNLYSL